MSPNVKEAIGSFLSAAQMLQRILETPGPQMMKASQEESQIEEESPSQIH